MDAAVASRLPSRSRCGVLDGLRVPRASPRGRCSRSVSATPTPASRSRRGEARGRFRCRRRRVGQVDRLRSSLAKVVSSSPDAQLVVVESDDQESAAGPPSSRGWSPRGAPRHGNHRLMSVAPIKRWRAAPAGTGSRETGRGGDKCICENRVPSDDLDSSPFLLFHGGRARTSWDPRPRWVAAVRRTTCSSETSRTMPRRSACAKCWTSGQSGARPEVRLRGISTRVSRRRCLVFVY